MYVHLTIIYRRGALTAVVRALAVAVAGEAENSGEFAFLRSQHIESLAVGLEPTYLSEVCADARHMPYLEKLIYPFKLLTVGMHELYVSPGDDH